MNIFVIGNGFDLAHELPTKYGDFLEFLMLYQKYTTRNSFRLPPLKEQPRCKNNIFYQIADSFISRKNDDCEKLQQLLSERNLWIEYFIYVFRNKKFNGENWIDLESEISRVIQHIDLSITPTSDNSLAFPEKTISLSNLMELNNDTIQFSEKYKEKYIHLLEKDLDDFTKCLELYMLYLNKLTPSKIFNKLISPPQSDNTKRLPNEEIQITKQIPINAILSFNYTNFLAEIYSPNLKSDRICHIHGKLENNNLILGIDEYLPPEMRNKNVQCIHFKKFFQRIFKKTDNRFVHWLNIAENHHLHIIGHSLDVTDHDVLKKLIERHRMHTTIYHYRNEDFAKHVTNMVLMLGQEEVVKCVNNGTIQFKDLKELY